MKGTILKRLEDLERLYKQDPLMVLARTDSGEEIKITMRECLEREDTQFMKVIAGSSLQDLDLLLKATHEEAERQAQEGERVITNEYIDSLGIEKEKADELKTALRKEAFYRGILYKIGVVPAAIEGIMQTVNPADIDETQEAILTEKARVEWADFIPVNKRK